jgi:dienelactone hydrolase
MYLSESLAGDPIAVTGTVTVPDGEPPDGGRELVAIAHGTTGIADECAPSKTAGVGEGALAPLATDRGYVLATTDYEGLGTPGRHPYLVGESEGRSVLDAALAARQLPGAGVGDRFAVAGYSQGGHGALWAGQLASEWAPDLELVGTFAGAPASELPIIFGAAESMPIVGFLYMIIAGFEAAYPDEADPSLVLTDAGLEALAEVDEGCAGQVLPRLGELPRDDLLRPGVASVEPWATLAAENDPGRVATDSPILIIHSAADDIVPAALSQILFDRMCGLGQQVERRVYDAGQDHGEAAPQAYVDGFDWIADRFAGEPASSTCP